MTPLSPTANAILDAFLNGYVADLDTATAFSADRSGLAAALRAAAAHLRDAYVNEEYVDSADDWIDDLANELYPTPRP